MKIGIGMSKKIKVVLGIAAVAGWVIMFLAGSDVWNETGRKDVWNLQGAAYADLRVFLYCFYGLLVLLVASLGLDVLSLVSRAEDK